MIFLWTILFFLSTAWSFRVERPNPSFCSTVRSKYDRAAVYNKNFRVKENRWKDGKVYYTLANYFNEWEKNLVREAISEIESKTCVKWILRQRGETPFVRITADKAGCFADLGISSNRDEYVLNIARYNGQTSCWHKYIIVHEMLHNMGMDHEQNRADRDKYITVHWDNVARGQSHNFMRDRTEDSNLPICNTYSSSQKFDDCTSNYVTETFGLPYDVTSIMHYEKFAFSKNGRPTMTTKDGSDLTVHTELSSTDVQKINRAYCDAEDPRPGPGPEPEECVDAYSECQQYLSFCNQYQDWSKTNCNKSCGFC